MGNSIFYHGLMCELTQFVCFLVLAGGVIQNAILSYGTDSTGNRMERFTVSLDDELAQQFGQFMAQRGYTNRSEAVRDLIRTKLEQERLQQPLNNGYCIGSLTYVYNHHERELASRVTQAHHDHHDLTVAIQHVHLDHDNCLETVILRGLVQSVQAFADDVISSPGIRHGKLHLIPVDAQVGGHTHGRVPYTKHFQHLHFRPIT